MNARTSPKKQLDQTWPQLRLFSAIVVAGLMLAACGTEFGRDDAIVALQTTGVTEVEATCLADSLAVLGQLDAADPREPRTEERREAFVAASARCVQPEALPVVVEQVVEGEVNASVLGNPDNTPFVMTTQPGANGLGADQVGETLDEVIAEAVAELQRQGRTEPNSTCIVEFLTGAQATHLFSEPSFGLGLAPLEASAMAACLSTQ